MRNYIKKKEKEASKILESVRVMALSRFAVEHKKQILCVMAALLFIPVIGLSLLNRNVKEVDISESTLTKLTGAPMTAATAQRSVISIPNGVVKANPFVPYREVAKKKITKASDVPAFSLVEPPEIINENSDAARVMDTIVSGILYDKYSPSAILNIEGSDYLVKKGDVVNNYKVVNIMQDSVTVQLGSNVYKAGIGEILTEGNLNHNNVSNLKNKFGGERR